MNDMQMHNANIKPEKRVCTTSGVWRKIDDFASKAEIAGGGLIARTPVILRPLFAMIWLVLLGLFLNLVGRSISQYLEDPRGTYYNIIGEFSQKKYPVIYLCGSTHISAERLPQELRDVMQSNLSDWRSKLKEDLVAKFGNLTLEEFQRTYGWIRPLNEEGKSNVVCAYGTYLDMFCDIKRDMRYVITDKGPCIQVNANNTLEYGVGDMYSFNMMFVLDQHNSIDISSDSLEIFVRDHNQSITMFDQPDGIAQAGSLHIFDIRPVERESIEFAPKTKERVCYRNNDNYLSPYGNMTPFSCEGTILLNYTRDTWGCVTARPLYQIQHYPPTCTIKTLAPHIDHKGHVTITAKNLSMVRNAALEAGIPCLRSCYSIQYQLIPYSMKIGSNIIRWLIKNINDTADVRAQLEIKNYIENTHFFIRFRYPTDNINIVREEKQYTASSLFGEVGGQFGLFLGGSIITILQILYWIFFHIFKYIFKFKHQWIT